MNRKVQVAIGALIAFFIWAGLGTFFWLVDLALRHSVGFLFLLRIIWWATYFIIGYALLRGFIPKNGNS